MFKREEHPPGYRARSLLAAGFNNNRLKPVLFIVPVESMKTADEVLVGKTLRATEAVNFHFHIECVAIRAYLFQLVEEELVVASATAQAVEGALVEDLAQAAGL